MNLDDTDKFLVNRDNNSYYLESQNLMSELLDDDLLLVNREGLSYKITGGGLIGSIIDPLSVTVVISPTSGYINVEHTANPVASGGKAPTGGYVYTYQWIIADDANGTNATDLTGETSSTYTPVSSQLGKYLGCACGTTDALGTSASGTGYVGPITAPEVAVDIDDVVLTQNQTNANRFTSNSFTTTVTYTETPFPAQSVEMTAKVVGALGIEAGTDVITSNDYTGTASTSVPLTLNSDVYLTDGTFEVGDVVEASASYTPQSSEIVSKAETYLDFTGTESTSTVGSAGSTSYGDVINNVFGQTGSGTSGKSGWWGIVKNGGETDTQVRVQKIYTLNTPYTGGRPVEIYCKGSTNSSTQNIIYDGKGVGNNAPSVNNAWIRLPSNWTFFGVLSYQPSTNDSQVTGIGGIRWGDTKEVITDTSIFNGYVLTFTTEKDIELFQVGDKVQRELAIEFDDSQIWSNGLIGAIDNNLFAFGSASQTSSATPMTINFSPALTGSIEFYAGRPNDSTRKVGLSINGTDQTNSINQDFGGATRVWNNGATFTGITSLGFFISGGTPSTVGISSLKIGGKWLLDPGTVIPDNYYDYTQVAAVNVSNNTITVDGGSWDASNQSQVWSETISATDLHPSGNSPSLAFDGNASGTDANTFLSAVDASIIWDCSSYDLTSDGPVTVEVYTFGNDVSDSRGWKVNDGALIPEVNTGSPHYLTLGTFSTLNKIESVGVSPHGAAWSAIRINGALLVDAVNESQVWSNRVSVDNGWRSSDPITNAFNGDNTNWAIAESSNQIVTIDLSGAGLSGTLVVNVLGLGASSAYIVVNDDDAGKKPYPSATGEVDFGNVGAINKIELVPDSNTAMNLVSIAVDGKILVDPGARYLGDTKVSTLSPKQGEGTISDITGSVVTIDPFVDNCFKDGQYLTHTTPKAIKITPKTEVITDVNDLASVLTFAGNEELIEFANGDPVTMCDADGNLATILIETDPITSAGPPAPPTSFLYAVAPTDYQIGTSDQTQLVFQNAWAVGQLLSINQFIIIDTLSADLELDLTPVSSDAGNSYSDDLINWYQGSLLTSKSKFNEGRYYWLQSPPIGYGGGITLTSAEYSYDVIELSGSTNLEYFKEGDVLQGGQYTIQDSPGVPTTDPYIQYLFQEQSYQSNGRRNKTTTFIFDPPIPINKEFSIEIDANGDSAQFLLLDEYNATIGSAYGGSYSYLKSTVAVSSPTSIKKMRFIDAAVPSGDNPFNNKYKNFVVDGKDFDVLSQSLISNEIVVLEDPTLDPPQLIVSGGGNWDTSNQSQVWSSQLSSGIEGFVAGKGPEWAFNGNVGDVFTTLDDVGPMTFTPTVGIPFTTSIEVYSHSTGGTGIIINDSITVPIDSGSWTKYSGSGVLNKLVLDPGDVSVLGGIKVDGNLLVDAVNDSQVWSNAADWTVSNIESGSVSNLFNGDTTEGLVFASDGSAEWTIPGSYDIKGSLKVRAYVGTNDDSLPQFFYNGVWNTPIEPNEGATGADYTWETGTSVVTGFKYAGSSGSSPAVYAIYQDGKLLVDTGVRDLGDTTVTKQLSGTGTVGSVSLENNTMTLSTNNDEWVEGYYVKGPLKNKIEKTAYLKFDASGTVEEISRLPQSAVTMTASDPVLTFPAQFGTGEVPDTELAYPTSLQTEITAKNTFASGTVNTDTQASNSLYPQFTGRSIPASGEKRTTAEGLAQFIANVDTFSGRQAAANTDPTDATSIYNAKLLEINEELE